MSPPSLPEREWRNAQREARPVSGHEAGLLQSPVEPDRRFAFSQVDVFTDIALLGNPLAVVHAADGVDEARMQAFARWTHLSETAFLLRPTHADADYRVRIFTPGGELPFAGHPTLGSCHAWLEAGGVPRDSGVVVQECEVGLVRIRRAAGRLAFAAPPVRSEDVEPALLDRVCAAMGLASDRVLASRWLDNGPRWLALQLDSVATVLALAPDHAAMKSLAKVAVVAQHPAGAECQFEVRAFAAPIGVPEDPVTGSVNASLAGWLMERGVAPRRYVAAQGACLGRAGRVHLEHDGATLWVGGGSVSVIRGSVEL